MLNISKILVANRGEIAIRVMRTCREMNIRTVAVFSSADRRSSHVSYADEAFCIDHASVKNSYLCIDKIIDVAKKTKADAIHPGYGFLSENHNFSKAVCDAGVIFIGPSADSIFSMANKVRARNIMVNAGVPVVPGSSGSINCINTFLNAIDKIGLPVILKASSGGGGKGLRRIDDMDSATSSFEAARSEAANYFNDDSVYVEKFLKNPRHIEIQILADSHGNVSSFPERECSVQRRHQKLIEESPSFIVDNVMREKMSEVARRAAMAVDYVGAGTIEFLVDDCKNFYFMEMNTRLQVEHPVTEMITGLDLVELQIRIARGEKLEIPKTISAKGWAIEARICAEDPLNNFLPTAGLVSFTQYPGGPFVRLDAGIFESFKLSHDYDSMLAKVISWGENRDKCIKRSIRALSELNIDGCINNIDFLKKTLESSDFVSGSYDTGLIEHLKESKEKSDNLHKDIALIAASVFKLSKKDADCVFSESACDGEKSAQKFKKFLLSYLKNI